jgi:localization factor PodJL
MKLGGPWNLRGLRPEARAAARDAARRSGMSVGEWLNTVIQPTEKDGEEDWWSDAEDRPSDRSARGTRDELRDRELRRSTEPPQPRREYPPGEPRRQTLQDDNGKMAEPHGDRPRHRDREQDAPQWRPATGAGDAPIRHRNRKYRLRSHEADELHSRSAPASEQSYERYRDRPQPPRERQPEDEVQPRSRDQDRGLRGNDVPPPQRHRNSESDDHGVPGSSPEAWRQREAYPEWRPPERKADPRGDERPAVRQDSYYAEQQEQSRRLRDEQLRAERQRRERELFERAAASAAAEQHRQASIDEAVAEITARQRALEQDRIVASARSWSFETQADAAPLLRESPPQAPQPSAGPELRPAVPPAEPERMFAPWPDGWRSQAAADSDTPHIAREAQRAAPEASIDLSGLQEQLREMTARIEALRPSSELEKAIVGLRSDLAEISRSFADALPRRALESLENEVRTLGQRIDSSRQTGVDSLALAGIERGLGEVREALRGLMPAEGLIGFDDALKVLSTKVDAIGGKDDPDALQQLEAAMAVLRGMISRVASDEALTRVAEDVRALSAKVDDAAGGGSNAPTLTALENRIDILASALNASAEAGHSVPRELEKLLSGLVEKLEQVQLTDTDRAALGHLEDRIAALVKRLDASDARLGLLEGVERGLSDLLVYVEQLRSAPNPGNTAGAVAPLPATAPIEPADPVIKATEQTKQTERPGTVAVHDDLFDDAQAIMELGAEHSASVAPERRTERPSAAQPQPQPLQMTAPAPVLSQQAKYEERPENEVGSTDTDTVAVEPAARFDQTGSTLARPAAARTPIDPSLPPDHPLEPGSTVRSRAAASPAERIAASEAAAGTKPQAIVESGASKPDFIAAARRAAQAASAASADGKKSAKSGPSQPKKLTERIRTLAVAAAVVVIVVGGFHIISRLFDDGSGSSVPARVEPALPSGAPSLESEPPRTQSTPPQQMQPETPPARKEPPHVEADPAPAANAMNLPAPVPLPRDAPSPKSVEPAAGATATPSITLPAQAPGRREGKAENHAPETAPPGAPLDITGSLPNAPAATRPQAPQAAAGAPAIADRLPAAIGGQTLRLAAVAGDPLAAYEIGVRFSEGRGVPASNEDAARWFEIAANKGIVPAQFRLGTLYEKGLGVKKDLIAARDLYRAAAERGHGKAMHNLAVIYAEGPEGKPDYTMAAEWFRKAADHGVADSQYNLAILYARGVGVEQNLAESYKWFFLAAKEGDQDAAAKRDEIASRIDRAALAAARAAAENWTAIPQPADAITVKGSWDPPGAPPPAAKPKPRSAKANSREASKVN